MVPLMINIRANYGKLPPGHWANDVRDGGGRIIGECCHFYRLDDLHDESVPEEVQALSGPSGTLVYTSEGSDKMEKEYFEVFGGGQSAVIHDFRKAVIYSGKKEKINRPHQDKG